MSVAFLFPGQGSQATGFLHRLGERQETQATLVEAGTRLDHDPLLLDTAEALESTVHVQLTLLIASVATARALQAQGVCPVMHAGHSVGAFAAAVSCGSLPFAAALDCVKIRGQAMQDAAPPGYGMMAIVGLTESQVVHLIDDIAGPDEHLYLAAVNAPQQIVLSGSQSMLTSAKRRAFSSGARSATALKVATPSHCALMTPVAAALTRALTAVEMTTPCTAYICNHNARAVVDSDAIREDLIQGAVRPVRWHDATTVMVERGANLFIEMPPGTALTRLAVTAFPEVRSFAATNHSLDSLSKFANAATDQDIPESRSCA